MAQKRKPVTVDELESFLDLVARLMDGAGQDAKHFLPIWRAVERELRERQEADAIFAAARDRLKRSSDRTAARSS